MNNDALLITEVLHAYNADRANWLFELARPTELQDIREWCVSMQ